MSPKSAKPEPTVGELVGRNVRRLRDERGQTQSWLAREMRSFGFMWAQATVAAVEAGKRAVSTEELVGLGEVLGPITELLAGPGRVRLNDLVMVPAADAAAVLMTRDRPTPLGGVMRSARGALTKSREYDPEVAKAARVLGVDRAAVADLAQSMYRRSIAEERDRRIGSTEGLAPRTLQARRGHVTRQLLDEMREQLHRDERGAIRGK